MGLRAAEIDTETAVDILARDPDPSDLTAERFHERYVAHARVNAGDDTPAPVLDRLADNALDAVCHGDIETCTDAWADKMLRVADVHVPADATLADKRERIRALRAFITTPTENSND